MKDPIDIMIADPASRDPDFSGLEAGVWARVEARVERARARQLRFAIVAVALVAGVANGQWIAPAAQARTADAGLFQPAVGLAALTSAEMGG
ncbi:hypothetical protein E4M02_07270 [Brevundimonas sp. S30B]|jgi:hypothetical protein|uniref:hypothetical protein n=1 Tax=unclassified Brevundimonas TaxID=2622653 RepID=UPI0010727534|nr:MULTISPECIES: hypothetical protein [unclassified Brevundimonas]QBX37867.1 hypothetical protein E4M01_08870 [Brevundimonas sp. MF30-B]TFW02777.1 hypothetical protein E4M02_07270 [Brevundimonas sp. S30B]